MFSKRLSIVTAALVVASVAIASAQMMPPPGPGGPGAGSALGIIPLPMLLQSVNLTDAQKQQVNQILSASAGTMRSQMETLEEAQQSIATRFTSPSSVSAADFSGDLAQVAEIRGQMQQQELETALAIRKLLTSDQLDKLAQAQTRLQEIHNQMHDLTAQNGAP